MVHIGSNLDNNTSYNLNIIAIPSFALLYAIDETIDAEKTIKILEINGFGNMNLSILRE